MNTCPFELGPIRPVDEAESLLIRTTRSCPWNRCEFCVNYKGMPFSIRSLDEIRKDIEAAAEFHRGRTFRTCFLQDGDSFVMKTADLIETLTFLKSHFPSLQRISSYGRAQTMIRKSPSEISEIYKAGLNKLYCGMESGSDAVLTQMHKGTTAADIIKSACMAKTAGMDISEFIILGLGGQALWQEHAKETARVLNQINPQYIRVLTIGVKPGSGLEEQVQAGKYRFQTEKNIIEEQRLLIETLDGITSHYANHHMVDLLMEARGQFPQDKPKLLAIMDRYLAMPEKDRIHYTLGKRFGHYQKMDDASNETYRRRVEAEIQSFLESYPDRIEEACQQLRAQVV